MNQKTIIRLLLPVAVRGVVTPPLGEPFEAPTGEAHVVLAMQAAELVSEEDFKKYQASRGPTFEEYIAAGYKPENYPPQGCPERPSPGLEQYRAEQKAAAEAKAKADEDAAALAKEVSSPGTIQQADPAAEHRDPAPAQETPPAQSAKRTRAK